MKTKKMKMTMIMRSMTKNNNMKRVIMRKMMTNMKTMKEKRVITRKRNHDNHQKPIPRREPESDTGPEARTTSPGGNPRDSEEDH